MQEIFHELIQKVRVCRIRAQPRRFLMAADLHARHLAVRADAYREGKAGFISFCRDGKRIAHRLPVRNSPVDLLDVRVCVAVVVEAI